MTAIPAKGTDTVRKRLQRYRMFDCCINFSEKKQSMYIDL